MTGLTAPEIKHIMGGIATAKTAAGSPAEGGADPDAEYNARLPADATALPLALDHSFPRQGDRHPARDRTPPLYVRRLRAAGGPAGPRTERAWRAFRRSGGDP